MMLQVLRSGMFVCVLLLAACGGGATSDTGGGQPAAGTAMTQTEQDHPAGGQAQPDATATSGAGPAGQSPLATLTRSGGIQGKTETLVVLGDGTLHLIEGEAGGEPSKKGKAAPDQINRLNTVVQSESWQQLEATYGQSTPDAYTYTIIVGSKTITTYDGAQKPALLEDVLAQLNDLWQQAAQS